MENASSEIPVARKKLPHGYENAVWDWRPFERGYAAGFFSDLQSRGVTAAYMDVGGYVDVYEMPDGIEKRRAIEDFNAGTKRYLVCAQENGIAVHALAGNADWGNASHRYLNRIILEYVQDFNLSNPDTAFQGVQFDIEPYIQEGFSAETSDAIFVQYLDTVEEITSAFIELQTRLAQFGPMKLGFVIPYWFDEHDEYARKVSWKGEETYVFYHVLYRLSRVQNGYLAIMAYRNFAEGPDGVIGHIQNQLGFSQHSAPGVKVIIGQETSNVDPKKITYFGKSFADMVEEVKKIGLKFENSPNVAGFAFNNADSFLELPW